MFTFGWGGPRARRFVRFWASGGAKFTKIGDSLPWTPMKRRTKFESPSFILGGKIRNPTNKQTNSNRYIHLAYRRVWIIIAVKCTKVSCTYKFLKANEGGGSGNGVGAGASTKLLYVGPGDYWDGWPYSGGQTTSVCNQPPWTTQPSTLIGTGMSIPAKVRWSSAAAAGE